MQYNSEFKIIASLSSKRGTAAFWRDGLSFFFLLQLLQKKKIKKAILKKNIEVISSIIKFTGKIDLLPQLHLKSAPAAPAEKMLNLMNLLRNQTAYSQNKKFLIVDVSGLNPIKTKLVDGNGIKVLQVNLFNFVCMINQSKHKLFEIHQKRAQFYKAFDINDVFKLYVIDILKSHNICNENIKNYDVIFVFNGIC